MILNAIDGCADCGADPNSHPDTCAWIVKRRPKGSTQSDSHGQADRYVSVEMIVMTLVFWIIAHVFFSSGLVEQKGCFSGKKH